MKYKSQKELAQENPGGMETLPNCHNFSSNPGFMSTSGMLGASTPAGGGTIRGTVARGSLPEQARALAPSGTPAHRTSAASR